MDTYLARQQQEAQKRYLLEQIGSELTQPWVVLAVVLVLGLLGLLTWRWIRRLPREARSTPLWRYGLYLLLLAGGLAYVLHLSNTLFQPSWGRRTEASRQTTHSVTTDGRSPPVSPPPPVPFSEALFRRLILVPWTDVACGTPPKPQLECAPWLFLPSGIFLRSVSPQAVAYASRDSHPSLWDMRATNEHSGVIATNKGTLLLFELVGDSELRLGGRLYRRGEYPELQLPPPPARISRPSRMSILAGFERLVATPWRKAHPFDPATQAERITFHPSMEFEASYRQGSCVHRAPFWVEESKLHLDWEDDACRVGKPTPPPLFVSPEYPSWFLGELLLLQDVYLPASAPPAPPRLLAGDMYWGVMVTGQFSQELRQGAPTELLLTLHLPSGMSTAQLGELWVWMRERWPENGPVKPRREQVLFSTPLSGREYRAQVTPQFGGPVELEVELSLKGHPGQAPPRRLFRVYAGEVAR